MLSKEIYLLVPISYFLSKIINVIKVGNERRYLLNFTLPIFRSKFTKNIFQRRIFQPFPCSLIRKISWKICMGFCKCIDLNNFSFISNSSIRKWNIFWMFMIRHIFLDISKIFKQFKQKFLKKRLRKFRIQE